MHDLEVRQASIDHHLESVRSCLFSSFSPPASSEGDQRHGVEEPRQGSRTAAKISHLRNMIASLTPVPATTEADHCSVFDRILASVETLWNDRRERASDGGAQDPSESEHQRLVAYVDPPMFRRSESLELSPISTYRHRRAGSSRI